MPTATWPKRWTERRKSPGGGIKETVGFGRAPARLHRLPDGEGEGAVVVEVVRQRQHLAARAPGAVREPSSSAPPSGAPSERRLGPRRARPAARPPPRSPRRPRRARSAAVEGGRVEARRRWRAARRGWGSWPARCPTRLSRAGIRRRRAQAAARSATKAMRPPWARSAPMGHCVASSKNASPLKLIARVMRRPSTSGRATFMATSRAERPAVPAVPGGLGPARKDRLEDGRAVRPGRGQGRGRPRRRRRSALTMTSGGACAEQRPPASRR